MDCSTARLFLQLGRPGAPRDLDAEEVAELDNHLEQCPACHQFDLDQRRLDAALGRAMLDVEVPSGLKEQIHLRLAADRAATHRRWGGRVFYAVSGVAAAVLLAYAGWLLWGTMRPIVASESVAQGYNLTRPGDKASADAQLRKLDLPPCSPTRVNYAYLTGVPSLAVLPGTEGSWRPVKVAQFVFVWQDAKARETHRAI